MSCLNYNSEKFDPTKNTQPKEICNVASGKIRTEFVISECQKNCKNLIKSGCYYRNCTESIEN